MPTSKKLVSGTEKATINPQAHAVKEARKNLGLTKFVPVGGSTPEGQALKREADRIRNG
jgi:hypothetical protein